MIVTKSKILGLEIIQPIVYRDSRGYFFESYSELSFSKYINKINFIQDNESKSIKGVLRGLHFQHPPFAQCKLVRCIKGEVLDIAVDIRKKSPTFGKYESVILSEKNKKQFLIPEGFAHGYVVLSEEAIFAYKVNRLYSPKHEAGIIWNDPDLNIDWKISRNKLIISDKDQNLLKLDNLKSSF